MSKQDQPTLLGKYHLGRLLGRGTFAKVYHARSVSDDSPVAIKVLEKRHLLASATSATVLLEVSAMRRLSHPNILNLHELLATKSKIYLVTDFAAGGDLLSVLHSRRSRRLPETAARRYFHQLVSALHHCHIRGVAHRDVKPQNILFDDAGNIKLSDFGLSAFLDDRLLCTACGTPAYTAPEVLRRRGYDGARADAWSCGVVLYTILVGNLPFLDASIPAMYRRIQRRDYGFPPWVSAAARGVIGRLLDPNPATRLTVEELVGNPWLLKRGLRLESEGREVGSGASVVPRINAFSIIAMLSGLDLSGLFEEGRRRARRFMTRETAERIVGRLGECVVGRKDGEFAPGQSGLVVVSVEVVEVAAPLVLVEVEVEEGGGEGERFCWEELKCM